jgi:hypothetical protein
MLVEDVLNDAKRREVPGWLAAVGQSITSCRNAEYQFQRQNFDRCVKRVRQYGDILVKPGLGLVVDNQRFHDIAYYKTLVAIPECLAKDPNAKDLFAALKKTRLNDKESVNETVTLIKKLCRGTGDKGLFVLPYVASVNSLDNPDKLPPNPEYKDNRGRIVVWINDTERNISSYVQFSVNTDSDFQNRKQASVVNVRKDGSDNGSGTYIFDWMRDYGSNQFVYDDQFGNDQHCYACHWTGVIAIRPFRPEKTADVMEVAKHLGSGYEKWLNDLNEKYEAAAIDINQQILDDTKKYWNKNSGVMWAPKLDQPSVLSITPTSTASTASTAAGCDTEQTEAIKILVGGRKCTGCHSSRGGGFYDGMGPGNYYDIMKKYIAGGLMPPPNGTMPTAESIAKGETNAQLGAITKHGDNARQCFMKTAKQNLEAWLKDTKCTQ